ncbi:DUF4232 domain-containing protein [Corynebacterium resistens]|uniref:DUF4232 domain-containing protein n=1 Tax=Corynebacterium resistens TaxID=258224 RepID=UPI00235769C8|nr:DUF4232 domain-containing protein [Corynebacterium resistens]
MKPFQTRSIRLLGVASLSALAVGLTACGANEKSDSPESTVYGSDSSQPSNAANAAGNGGVEQQDKQGNGSSNQDGTQNAAEKRKREGLCATDQLEVTASAEQGAAGTSYYNIVFTNKGSSECTLKGFPGVSLVKDNNGSQIGRSAKRDSSKATEPVALKPGGKAVANLGITKAELHGGSCTPTQADGIRVYPPEETEAAYVPLKATGCEGNVDTLKIQPVQPYAPDAEAPNAG